jgi:hypothetical protein
MLKNKVDVPNLVTYLKKPPIFEWYVVFIPWTTNQLIQLLVNWLPFVTIVVCDLTCQKMFVTIVALILVCQKI